MSYSRLHHESGAGNSSTHHVDLDQDSDDDSDYEKISADQGYRLRDLSQSRRDGGLHGRHPNKDIADKDGASYSLSRRGRSGSVSTTHSFMLYTPDEERIVKRKLDRHLVLFVAFLYMLSFLDRSST